MPGQLSLTVGTVTPSITFNGTNAKVNAAILRVLVYKNIETEGLTPTQLGEAYLLEVKKWTLGISRSVQRTEQLAANEAALEAILEADNAL